MDYRKTIKQYLTPEDIRYLRTRNNQRIQCSCGKTPFKGDMHSHKKTKFHINNNKDELV